MIKVLIVEDDPMVSELNKRYVKQMSGFATVGVLRIIRKPLNSFSKMKSTFFF
nr:hypothetical protein [Terribacillus saccharophilus]